MNQFFVHSFHNPDLFFRHSLYHGGLELYNQPTVGRSGPMVGGK